MNKLKFTRKQQQELVSKGKKGCSKCGEVLDLRYFQKQRTTKLGYRSNCRYCRHVNDRKPNAQEYLSKEDFYNKIDESSCKKERDYVKKISREFGISFKKAKKLAEVQFCEICGKRREENGKRLAVDHCHESGKIRGVLCSQCNSLLGMAKDSIETMKKAIGYLERFK